MLAPRSRGKGGRRFPGRDGGRRKAKAVPEWRKRAQHAVASQSDLTQPLSELAILGFYGDDMNEMIYKFDQCMAKKGLRYFVECSGTRHNWAFDLWVSVDIASDVQEIITRIKRK